jgi:hypothetical protein
MLVSGVEEIDDFTDAGVLHDYHVFGQCLQEGKEAFLGVEPGVGVELR